VLCRPKDILSDTDRSLPVRLQGTSPDIATRRPPSSVPVRGRFEFPEAGRLGDGPCSMVASAKVFFPPPPPTLPSRTRSGSPQPKLQTAKGLPPWWEREPFRQIRR
jgi:hypothetical protein